MAEEQMPCEIIDDMVDARAKRSDRALLTELAALAALPHDDDDPIWNDANSQAWQNLYLYRALCEVLSNRKRKLKKAIPLLLDRACSGDPGEVMRNLPDFLWVIADHDRTFLIETYLSHANSSRAGARLYAIDGLGQFRRFDSAQLDEATMESIDSALKRALKDDDRFVRMRADTWLSRIQEISAKLKPKSNKSSS